MSVFNTSIFGCSMSHKDRRVFFLKGCQHNYMWQIFSQHNKCSNFWRPAACALRLQATKENEGRYLFWKIAKLLKPWDKKHPMTIKIKVSMILFLFCSFWSPFSLASSQAHKPLNHHKIGLMGEEKSCWFPSPPLAVSNDKSTTWRLSMFVGHSPGIGYPSSRLIPDKLLSPQRVSSGYQPDSLSPGTI